MSADKPTSVGFLRRRRGEVGRVTLASPRYTAADKGKALAVLRGAVVLVAHPYERDPFSGAGNCWCGRAAANILHSVVVEP